MNELSGLALHEQKKKREEEQKKRWPLWSITNFEIKENKQNFDEINQNGFVTAQQAKIMFAASGLPGNILGNIWSLSDRDGDRKLNEPEFCMAKYFIRAKQRGEILPPSLDYVPRLLYKIYPSERPSDFDMGPDFKEDVQEYQEEFDDLSEFPTVTTDSSIQLPPQIDENKPKKVSPYRTIPEDYELPPPILNDDDYPPDPIKENQNYETLTNPNPVSSNPVNPNPVNPNPVNPNPVNPNPVNPNPVSSNMYAHLPPNHNLEVSPFHVLHSNSTSEVRRINKVEEKKSPNNSTGKIDNRKGFEHLTDRRGSSPVSPQSPKYKPILFDPTTESFGNDSSSTNELVQLSTSPSAKSPFHPSNQTTNPIGQSFSSFANNSNKTQQTSSGQTILPSYDEPPTVWYELKSTTDECYYWNPLAKEKPTTWLKPKGNVKIVPREKDNLTPLPPPSIKNENTMATLNDPLKVEFFKKFLEEEGSATQEIVCYLELLAFRQSISSQEQFLTLEQYYRAEIIYTKYMKKGALQQLTDISSSCLKTVRKYFEKTLDKKKVPSDVFNEVQGEIFQILQTSAFPKFLKSLTYIEMYNCMTNNQNTFELPDPLWKEFILAAEGSEKEGWIYLQESSGVLIHKKKYSGSENISIRGSGIVPLSVENMYKFAINQKLRKYWEVNFKSSKILQRLDEKTVILQYEYCPPGILKVFKNHEFVVLRTIKHQTDGSILVLSRSVYHADAPVRKDAYRDTVDCSGFVIRPLNDSSSVVTYVTQVHLHGIPNWAEEKYGAGRAFLIKKIRDYVEKERKKGMKSKGGYKYPWETVSDD